MMPIISRNFVIIVKNEWEGGGVKDEFEFYSVRNVSKMTEFSSALDLKGL